MGYAPGCGCEPDLFPWPVLRAPHEPTVSIVMVVRNEERWIESKLRNLLELDYPQALFQVVVVSDGSTDGTNGILRGYADDPRVRALMNQFSRGKAAD